MSKMFSLIRSVWYNMILVIAINLAIILATSSHVDGRSRRFVSPSRIQNLHKLKSDNKFVNRIYYDEIMHQLNMYPDSDTLDRSPMKDFNEIEVDYQNEFIYVGAKNYLIKLSFRNDSLKLVDQNTDLLAWEPEIDTINDCRSSTSFNSAKYCQNYIRLVLLGKSSKTKDRILLCGTYARQPTCTWRSKFNLQQTLDTFDGIGKCPNSPDSSLAYISSSSGDIYFATSIDYSEQGMRQDYLIDRSLGPSNQIRTDQFNSNWLNDPIFVASVEIGNYVYFFMREKAIEYMNCGEKIYSRVVRLCKYDQGTMNYNVWKSFEKARLNCSVPGNSLNETSQNNYKPNHQYPFYFDEVQNVYYDKEKNLIYAIFTTPLNGVKGSAVCVYDVNSLETAFDGPFKHQKAQDSIWEPFTKPMEKTQCSASMKSSKYSHNFQLKHLSIQPLYNQPILVIPNQRISKLVVDNVLSKHNNDLSMFFIATEHNTILKYMVLNMYAKESGSRHLPTTCLLEEVEVLETFSNQEPKLDSINNLVLLNEVNNRNLLIATSSNLIKMPVANCQAQNNYFSCLSLMDPYCIWDSKAQKCLFIFRTNETQMSSDSQAIARSIYQNSHLHQHSINGCPMKDVPIDGGFSEWGDWVDCMAKTGEKCKCRMRLCNSPTPRNGGKSCDEKSSIEILNCQIHGGWTSWSAWSACKGGNADSCELSSSVSSQPAIRTRFRTCTNPEPKFNGRICIGLDQEEELCTPDMISPCAKLVSSSQWMSWGAWEACSKNCGGGFQMRRRLCNSKVCFGCNQEWRTCNSDPCKNRIESQVTSWTKINQIPGIQQKLEQRNKFTCKFDSYLNANGLEGMELNATTEYRLCNRPQSCRSLNNLNDLGKFTEWTNWSKCRSCEDIQIRTRKCDKPNSCFGLTKEAKKCVCSQENEASIDRLLIGQIPKSFTIVHLLIACALAFLLGSFIVLLIILICFRPKSKSSQSRSFCCCSKSSKSSQNTSFASTKNHNTDNNLSSSLGDHNSVETDTALTDALNSESTKLQYSDASSSNSNHSKEYFTIGNRFEQTNLTSLLNGTIPDDTEDELNTFQVNNNLSGTLGRGSGNKMNPNGLPNKSFNTYATHASTGNNLNNAMNSNKNSKNMNNCSGLNITNSRLGANAASINASNRLSNYGIANSTTTGSMRATIKQPRNSFAFTMRTNLDQEL